MEFPKFLHNKGHGCPLWCWIVFGTSLRLALQGLVFHFSPLFYLDQVWVEACVFRGISHVR